MSTNLAMPNIDSTSTISEPNRTLLWKGVASVVVLFHLLGVSLSYTFNHRTSEMQDAVLSSFQPYLIATNFFHESLPFEWVEDENGLASVRISIQRPQGEWTEVVSTHLPYTAVLGLHDAKANRLLQLLVSLANRGDEEGVLRILKDVMAHLDSVDSTRIESEPATLANRIRLELPSFPLEDGTVESVTVEAAVARFDGGEIGLIPLIEKHRSVRSRSKVTIGP
jgi:hypothetical protein